MAEVIILLFVFTIVKTDVFYSLLWQTELLMNIK